jgi:phosphate uptake regulator
LAKQETLNPITAFNYMQLASNLERIADHAHLISQIAKSAKAIWPRT